MDRTRNIRRAGWLLVLAVCAASGCQTVKTPEEKIANSNIPSEFKKVSMPDYVIEPPDLVLVEVLEALPGRPISGERLVRPDGKISLGFYGEVYVAGLTISEAKEKVIYHLRKYLSDEGLGLLQMEMPAPKEISQAKVDKDGKPLLIENFKDCDRVFLDVTAYNSKNYYVLGDVAAPGRLPVTGNETVLDAIEFAGGLLPTAAPQNIRLVRPAPPGACCEQSSPGQPVGDHERRRLDHQLPAHAWRPDRRLSRPDRANHHLHRSPGRTVPDRPEHDAPVLLHGPFARVPAARSPGYRRSRSSGQDHDNPHPAQPAGCSMMGLISLPDCQTDLRASLISVEPIHPSPAWGGSARFCSHAEDRQTRRGTDPG